MHSYIFLIISKYLLQIFNITVGYLTCELLEKIEHSWNQWNVILELFVKIFVASFAYSGRKIV